MAAWNSQVTGMSKKRNQAGIPGTWRSVPEPKENFATPSPAALTDVSVKGLLSSVVGLLSNTSELSACSASTMISQPLGVHFFRSTSLRQHSELPVKLIRVSRLSSGFPCVKVIRLKSDKLWCRNGMRLLCA